MPSSTKDQPDVSLHDHSMATAAVASVLTQWHEEAGTRETEAHIEDLRTPKFRVLIGDLSGIQSTLFQLANEQVKGVNRILRARSFLFGLLVESAAIEARRRLGLTSFCRLQSAGGRFLLLVPACAKVESMVAGLRQDIDGWMMRRWRGELSLQLALTEPFGGELLQRDQFGRLQALIGEAAEEAKQRPLATAYTAVHREDRYPEGACQACGARPSSGTENVCRECELELHLGRDLPHLRAWGWSSGSLGRCSGTIPLWRDLRVHWFREDPGSITSGWIAGCSAGKEAFGSGLPRRSLSNYVPRMEAGEGGDGRYEGLGEEEVAKAGEVKMFGQIALDSLEIWDGALTGEDFLGVLKADVDRLGAIFGQGVQNPSLGMMAGLSRRLDYFFSGYLPELLRTTPMFRSTYTVYAGGDDLLLIGPWRQMAQLALRIREDFVAWTGSNPQITLSAGLELVHVNEPLNRSVVAAEERLELAKGGSGAGRNRICAIGNDAVPWPVYAGQLELAEELAGYLRKGYLGLAFLYRVLGLDDDRMAVLRAGSGEAESAPLRMERAAWRARWSYQFQRNIRENSTIPSEERARVEATLQQLMGLSGGVAGSRNAPSARTPITVAVYRNRGRRTGRGE